MPRLRRVFPGLLLAALAACSATPEAGAGPAPASEVRVEVANNSRRDVAVYAVRSGSRTRLGTATSGATGRFVVRNVRQAALSDFRLAVETIGSDERFTTERVLVNPGQTVTLEIGDLLSTSRVSVR